MFPATTSLQSAAELDSQVLLTQIKPSAAASKTQDLIGRISIQQPQPQRSAAKQITASEKARPHRRQERQAIRTYLLHHIPARKSPNSICDSCLVQVYLHRHAISHTSFLSNSILTLSAILYSPSQHSLPSTRASPSHIEFDSTATAQYDIQNLHTLATHPRLQPFTSPCAIFRDGRAESLLVSVLCCIRSREWSRSLPVGMTHFAKVRILTWL